VMWDWMTRTGSGQKTIGPKRGVTVYVSQRTIREMSGKTILCPGEVDYESHIVIKSNSNLCVVEWYKG